MSNQDLDTRRTDQGRIARLAVFWSLALLVYYGCTSLRAALVGTFTKTSSIDLASPLIASMPKIPVLGAELSGALVISVIVFAAAMFFIWRWIERPKSSQLLVETEVELRKVTWPTGQEVFNSSIVVVICVLFLMAFLAGADYVLAKVAGVVLFGGAG